MLAIIKKISVQHMYINLDVNLEKNIYCLSCNFKNLL